MEEIDATVQNVTLKWITGEFLNQHSSWLALSWLEKTETDVDRMADMTVRTDVKWQVSLIFKV